MWQGKRPVDDLNFYSLLGIVQCGMWLQSDIEKYLSGYDISYGRFSIMLAILESENRTITNNDLSIRLGISKTTITKMIAKLVDENLIEYRIDEKDLRKKRFTLTKNGKIKLEEIIPGYLERMRIIGSNISLDEKHFLIQVLGKINFLDSKKQISKFSERPVSEFAEEIKGLCRIGDSESIDQVMIYLDDAEDVPTTKIIDYYLGTVENIEGMKRIEYYLFNGTQIQKNYSALFFVRRDDWKIVNKAYKSGEIDYIQAFSK